MNQLSPISEEAFLITQPAIQPNIDTSLEFFAKHADGKKAQQIITEFKEGIHNCEYDPQTWLYHMHRAVKFLVGYAQENDDFKSCTLYQYCR